MIQYFFLIQNRSGGIIAQLILRCDASVRKIILLLQLALIFLIVNPLLYAFFNVGQDSFDLQRVTEWGVFGLAILIMLIDQPLRLQTLGILQGFAPIQRILLIFLFSLGVASSLHAHFPMDGLLEVMSFYCLFLSSLVMAGLVSLNRGVTLKNFQFFLIITMGANSFIALIIWVIYISHPHLLGGDLSNQLSSPGYMNRRFYDDVQCMVIPFLICFACLKTNSPLTRILAFLILSFCYARGLMGGSRIYYYETALFTLLFPLIYRKASIRFLSTQWLAIGLGLAFYFLMYIHSHKEYYPFSLTYLNHRTLLWSIAITLMLKHPFLGVGPMHFGVYAYAFENYAAHPHNMVLFIASQWGIPALLCVFALMMLGIRPVDREHPLFSMALLGSLLIGILMMQADDLMQMPAGQMMLMMVVGLTMGLSAANAPFITQKALSPVIQGFPLGLGLLAFLGILAIGGPMFMNNALSIFHFFNACSSQCLVAPDYWSQGFI